MNGYRGSVHSYRSGAGVRIVCGAVLMRTFYAIYGAILCALAILCAYSLAGAGQTLPWQGYRVAWLIIGYGHATGIAFLTLATTEAR